MGIIYWFQKKFIIIPLLMIIFITVILYAVCGSGNNIHGIALEKTTKDINSLKTVMNVLHNRISGHVSQYLNVPMLHEKVLKYLNTSELPKIFLVTPTYTRYTQQADLIRMSNTLKLIVNLHWIVVEDSDKKTDLVANLLTESEIIHTHLNVKTQRDLQMDKNDPRWKKHRGVDQRNLALSWIRTNLNSETKGVFYLADDDNTYHVRLFEEMRFTQVASIWPVALVGGLRWEGPICKNGKVTSFFTAWEKARTFPVDMAAFAINLKLLFNYPDAKINPDSKRGYLETDFLQSLHVTVDLLEAKADNCKKILIWHTQTADPKMKEELKMNNHGESSDMSVII